ncbi:MAG: DNA polymerase IV [candidate division WOR-3 bacterium]
MLILHIDMDTFYVSCERLKKPWLFNKPVIVGGPLRRRGVVASASYEARKFGIKAGMAIDYAHRLCPEAIIIQPDFPFYEAYSKKIYEILRHFSPIVAMTSIDEGYLDITGTEKLFGEPLQLGRKIKEAIRKLGLPSTVGIAKNPTLAKIATRIAKPDGLFYLPKGKEEEYLASVPVETIPGIGEKNSLILKGAGIKTIGDFLKADITTLNRLMGKWAEKLRKNLTEEKWLEIRERPKSIGRSITLLRDIRNLEILEKTLYELLKEAASELREWQEQATIITVRIRFEDFTTITQRQKISPTDAHQLIFPKAKELLHSLIKKRDKKVRLLGITLSGFTTYPLQSSLFLPPEREIALQRLNKTLDQIRKKLGEDKVQEGRIFRNEKREGKPLIPYRQIYQRDKTDF